MKGILLVNLGTPDSASVKDVRKYLREFLMDKRVIDIPHWKRWLLVNFIIAPLRSPKSAKEYQKLFDKNGSPLKYFGVSVVQKLQAVLGKDCKVVLGMRYQNPSLAEALDQLVHCESLQVIPLFPQYASATTGSVIERVKELTNNWGSAPELKFVKKFFNQELFIETIVDQADKLMKSDQYDHFVFSYHGIPERQILKSSVENHCQFGSCCDEYGKKNQYCYRAQCFETSRLLAGRLGLQKDQFSITFQSRLGKTPWIGPYTDQVLKTLPAKGIKKVLVFSPSFVSDCLETTVEVGESFRDQFLEAGGEKWTLVPSLNDEEKWVECLAEMVLSK